jgi:hypothetical protein
LLVKRKDLTGKAPRLFSACLSFVLALCGSNLKAMHDNQAGRHQWPVMSPANVREGSGMGARSVHARFRSSMSMSYLPYRSFNRKICCYESFKQQPATCQGDGFLIPAGGGALVE